MSLPRAIRTTTAAGDSGEVVGLTALIQASRAGNEPAHRRLLTLVYDELRLIARHTPHVGRPGDTDQPTAIANELALQLARDLPPPPRTRPESRATFFHSLALAARTLLRDRWRARNAQRRGGGRSPVRDIPLDARADPGSAASATDLLAVEEVLERLRADHPRWFDVVQLRWFEELSFEQVAARLDVGPTTAKLDWRLARAWLHRELEGGVGARA